MILRTKTLLSLVQIREEGEGGGVTEGEKRSAEIEEMNGKARKCRYERRVEEEKRTVVEVREKT